MGGGSVLPQTFLPGGQMEGPQTLNTDPCLPQQTQEQHTPSQEASKLK